MRARCQSSQRCPFVHAARHATCHMHCQPWFHAAPELRGVRRAIWLACLQWWRGVVASVIGQACLRLARLGACGSRPSRSLTRRS
eukprot:7613463-Alexandrium_andersonii.AAC.1